MNAKHLQKYLLHLCICVVACAYAALALGAESNAALYAALEGRWEGTLNGAFRAQEISWHFDVDDDGRLQGYIGPSNAGMPKRRMEDLVVSAGELHFTLASQHVSFSGTITPAGIVGSWLQGSTLPLQMRKKDFAFPLSAPVRAALAGIWEMENNRANIRIAFREAEGDTLAGFLSMPGNVGDAPLVDIFVTDEGFAQFATDNGQRFTGRLVNGVLLGEFNSGSRRYRRNFLRVDDARNAYDLALTEAAQRKLLGRWHARVRGDDVVLEVVAVNDGQSVGRLLFDEGSTRQDDLLELTLEADTVSYTTVGGRTFKGSFDGAHIAGDYFNNGTSRAYAVRYQREEGTAP